MRRALSAEAPNSRLHNSRSYGADFYWVHFFEEYKGDYDGVLISMQMYYFMITFPVFHYILYLCLTFKKEIQFTLSCVSAPVYCSTINFKGITQ